MTRDNLLELVRKVLRLPTAPYHERRVYEFICRFCASHGLEAQSDPSGNLIVRYQRGRRHPPLVFVAHMDHPGFEYRGGRTAEFLGGVPAEVFPDAQVRFYDASGQCSTHRVIGCRHASWPQQKIVTLASPQGLTPGDFGMWDLIPFRLRGGLLYGAAIDDLLGVAATLAALIELQRQQVPAHVWGVFTRAEEVGACGARLIAKRQLIPCEAAVISIEMSSRRPWARIGKGPVIRIGDRFSVFDPAISGFLAHSAKSLVEDNDPSPFAFQRALMDGGVCEATVFGAHGYRTGGLCLPLGNYHNIGRDKKPAPEYVSVRDLESLVRLMQFAAQRWRGFRVASRECRRQALGAWRCSSQPLQREFS